MDQITQSNYPVPQPPYTISSTLWSVGIFLFLGAPIRYMIVANAEESMILTAYSFFFFLASFLTHLCCADINDD